MVEKMTISGLVANFANISVPQNLAAITSRDVHFSGSALPGLDALSGSLGVVDRIAHNPDIKAIYEAAKAKGGIEAGIAAAKLAVQEPSHSEAVTLAYAEATNDFDKSPTQISATPVSEIKQR